MMEVDTVFLSSGASRQRHGSVWTPSGWFYYASCHHIVACRVESTIQGEAMLVAKHTLVGHVEKVLCLAHVDSLLVSSGADGVVRVWQDPECTQVLRGPGPVAPLHALACLQVGSRMYIASSNSLGQTCLWTRASPHDPFELHQTWSLAGQYTLSLAMALQPHSHLPMLAAGTTKSLLHLYVPNTEDQFEQALTLQGHEGWVNCLAFTTITESTFTDDPENGLKVGDVLLASGAMDKYIRLWRFTTENIFGDTLADTNTMASGNGLLHQDFMTIQSGQISTKAHVLYQPPHQSPLYIFLDSVMFGHDDWIHQVAWSPFGPLRLLSGSSDKSIFVWSFRHGAWSTVARVGEQGGTEQIFYSVCWSPVSPDLFCGTSYSGAIYLWHVPQDSTGCQSLLSCGGHLGPVKKIKFDPGHAPYVITCGLDRTTRLLAPWGRTWHEFGRIQIHGYDLCAFDLLDAFTLCSGAEEKVLRVFAMPVETARLLAAHGVSVDVARARGRAAALPALGLSNKAVDEGDDAHTDPRGRLPTESRLLRETLWPELEKLYGHPNELMAVSCAPYAIASTCRATQQAAVRIHDPHTWTLRQELPFHTLTVNALQFSPTSHRYLLSAGRDRSWALWKKKVEGEDFELLTSATKCHARIIWDVAWDPDEKFFVTASRDKLIKVWQLQNDQVTCTCQLQLPEAVTAVAVNHILKDYYIAAGDELGRIHFFHGKGQFSEWSLIKTLPQKDAHTLSVNSLSWGGAPSKGFYLASCSEDHSVRIYSVHFDSQALQVAE